MKLIVGLGNPGTRYTFTRHNAGWRVLDAIAEKEGLQFKPGKGDYVYTRKMIENADCVLLKPMTFMNESGVAVLQAVETFNINIRYDLLVILDEFQLPLGAVRLKAMGGDGGHNGMASVVYHLQTERFARLRCGIDNKFENGRLVEYVLSPFESDEEQFVEEMVLHARDAALGFATLGTIRAMNVFNQSSGKQKNNPPDQPGKTEDGDASTDAVG